MKLKILIADDEQVAREGLKRALRKSFSIIEAPDGEVTWQVIQNQTPDLVLLDLNMPKLGGFQILNKVQTLNEPPLVITITAYGSERVAVEAMKAGAYDYITKPFRLDELRKMLAHAGEQIRLEKENRRLKAVLSSDTQPLVGVSKNMALVSQTIAKVANTAVSVLISGESGTGKELVARQIHHQSNRAQGPFIALNCAALPKELIESELFGYQKGAFTGAVKDTPGKFKLAHEGTLFLDEIGDMSLTSQAKVVRAIEERQITALGSATPIAADVRIISATNQDLRQLVTQGRFREDLFYRIRVVEIALPPLRERGSDILLLADYYLAHFAARHAKNGLVLTPTVSDLLLAHSWPGNVRELRNVIESLVILSIDTLDDTFLETQLLGPESSRSQYALQGRSFKEAKQAYTVNMETALIHEALGRTGGNITQAASNLGMKRQFLQQKLKQLNIDARRFRH